MRTCHTPNSTIKYLPQRSTWNAARTSSWENERQIITQWPPDRCSFSGLIIIHLDHHPTSRDWSIHHSALPMNIQVWGGLGASTSSYSPSTSFPWLSAGVRWFSDFHYNLDDDKSVDNEASVGCNNWWRIWRWILVDRTRLVVWFKNTVTCGWYKATYSECWLQLSFYCRLTLVRLPFVQWQHSSRVISNSWLYLRQWKNKRVTRPLCSFLSAVWQRTTVWWRHRWPSRDVRTMGGLRLCDRLQWTPTGNLVCTMLSWYFTVWIQWLISSIYSMCIWHYFTLSFSQFLVFCSWS